MQIGDCLMLLAPSSQQERVGAAVTKIEVLFGAAVERRGCDCCGWPEAEIDRMIINNKKYAAVVEENIIPTLRDNSKQRRPSQKKAG